MQKIVGSWENNKENLPQNYRNEGILLHISGYDENWLILYHLNFMAKIILFTIVLLQGIVSISQDIKNNPGSNHGNKFEQLGTILPTPNEYRTASGAPGPKYWQQRCDYDIQCELDEDNRRLSGKELITYTNNSPDILTYLWIQLDENQHSATNNSGYLNSNFLPSRLNDRELDNLKGSKDKPYGFNIESVADALGKSLPYTINKTMMRVDLPTPLKPGRVFQFSIRWNYNIVERMRYGGRGGYEYFPEDGNDIFTMTQWYPRLCVYSDFQGWQNKQFAGSGEFALTFGNFKVAMTVPSDHIVMATGECKNYPAVLNGKELERWKKVQQSKDILEIVNLEEAREKEKKRNKSKKTWIFHAGMVRDFAWGSSRKFVWDGMPVTVEGRKVMCMSAYGKEAYNLYRRYSTKAVAHTIKTYSKFTIPYPYPVAQSIEASNGMEYPMICFNFGRCEKDGTYSEGTKNGMIGVVIHEVGHNFFPMIINSDERQWTWLDEGLNTYCEYLSEELWDNKFPVGRGPAYKIVDYMKLPKDQLEPIMTNSENIIQFGPNAYSKPATALNILRETVVGRNLFDFAFREYARRWAFKHPTPADLFRTIEDASGEDLDWFWRGWFFGTEPCDIAIDTVRWSVLNLEKDSIKRSRKPLKQSVQKPILNNFEDISKIRNREDKKISFETDRDTSLRDFYWKYARGLVRIDSSDFEVIPPFSQDEPMTEEEKKSRADSVFLYEVSFLNKGGLVMPIIVEWNFEDGNKETDRISAYIWRKNENKATRVFVKNRKVKSIKLDPMRETADINESNNNWPQLQSPSKFQLFRSKSGAKQAGNNPMQKEIK